MSAEIAQSHHEKFNGNGYPSGLKGTDIPLAARIVAVADVFDALVNKRVYKDAFPLDTVHDMILEGSGDHFDPAVVNAFEKSKEKFLDIFMKFKDQ